MTNAIPYSMISMVRTAFRVERPMALRMDDR